MRNLIALAMMVLANLAYAESKPNTGPKLVAAPVKLKVKGFDEAMVTPGASFAQFETFFIEQSEIVFDKRWKRDIRFEMSDRDEQRILTKYGQALGRALQKTFSEKTPLIETQQVTDKTLVIKPELTRFRITAPDLSHTGFNDNYVDYVGSARVHFTLKDANDKVLAHLSDHDLTRSYNGIMELKKTNRAENMHDFKKLYRRWAAKLSRFVTTQTAAPNKAL